jgi:hypothetical protein
MKEKIRSAIRNWARFHYWDSATINDLTDEILKLTQPSEKPSATTIERTKGEITITSTGKLGSDPNPNSALKVEKPTLSKDLFFDSFGTSIHDGYKPHPSVHNDTTEKPSAEEWLDQEFGDAYIEHDGFGDTKFLSKGMVIEALKQYAKQ